MLNWQCVYNKKLLSSVTTRLIVDLLPFSVVSTQIVWGIKLNDRTNAPAGQCMEQMLGAERQ